MPAWLLPAAIGALNFGSSLFQGLGAKSAVDKQNRKIKNMIKEEKRKRNAKEKAEGNS